MLWQESAKVIELFKILRIAFYKHLLPPLKKILPSSIKEFWLHLCWMIILKYQLFKYLAFVEATIFSHKRMKKVYMKWRFYSLPHTNQCTTFMIKCDFMHQIIIIKSPDGKHLPWKHSLASPAISTASPLRRNIAKGGSSLDLPPKRKTALQPRLKKLK